MRSRHALWTVELCALHALLIVELCALHIWFTDVGSCVNCHMRSCALLTIGLTNKSDVGSKIVNVGSHFRNWSHSISMQRIRSAGMTLYRKVTLVRVVDDER